MSLIAEKASGETANKLGRTPPPKCGGLLPHPSPLRDTELVLENRQSMPTSVHSVIAFSDGGIECGFRGSY